LKNKQTKISQKHIPIGQLFSALRHHNYRLWFIGQLFSLVGTWMQTTAQGFLVYSLTGSTFYLGLVSFFAGLPTFIFALYGGVIADRFQKRNLMLVTQSSMLILAFILAGLVFANIIQPWMIIVLAFLLGVANAFDGPVRNSFVFSLVEDRDDLTNAMALNSGMFNMAIVLGPSIAGFVYAWKGPAWCFTINGISFLAVIIALLMMRIKSTSIKKNHDHALLAIKDSFRYVLGNKKVMLLIASLGVISIFAIGLLTLIPAWAVQILHGGVTTNGFLLSSRGLGAVVGSLVVAGFASRRMRGKLWTIGSFILASLIILFAVSGILLLSMFLLFGVGLGLMLILINTNSLVQTTIPDQMRGRVMALYMVVFEGGIPVGSLLVGASASILDPRLIVLTCGAVLLLFALMAYFIYPKMRTQE
jgi:predicted MFS family arabinose efflux permease